MNKEQKKRLKDGFCIEEDCPNASLPSSMYCGENECVSQDEDEE
jgi:hypothetical protein